MITLYNSVNPFNTFKNKNKISSSRMHKDIYFKGDNDNQEIIDRLIQDFNNLDELTQEKTVEKVIKQEFGKEIPGLAREVLKRLQVTPNMYGIA